MSTTATAAQHTGRKPARPDLQTWQPRVARGKAGDRLVRPGFPMSCPAAATQY